MKILNVFNDDRAPDLFDTLYLLGCGLVVGAIGGILISSQMMFGGF